MSRMMRLLFVLFALGALFSPVAVSAAPDNPVAAYRRIDYKPGGLGPVPRASPHAAADSVATGPAEAAPVDGWSRLAFQSIRGGNWDIFSMRADGSDLRQLTSSPAADGRPRQSHTDGTVAFVSDRTGDFEIFTMASDGSNVRQLTYSPGEDNYPTWSPDGKLIAFASQRSGNWDIFVMNADGSNLVALVTGPTDDYGPVWSPDGKSIAWIRANEQKGCLWAASPDGSSLRAISSCQLYLADLAWSPDSQRIAFDFSWQPDGHTDIGFVLADGTTPSPIFLHETQSALTDASMGGYAPDGSRYVFSLIKYVVIDNDVLIESTSIATKTAWSPYAPPVVLPGSGFDLNPDWQRTDFTAPTSRLYPPAVYGYNEGQGLRLTWSGSDAGGSGVAYYNFQYKVDTGPWIAWPSQLTEAAVQLGWQTPGATLSFRVQAVDAAGNLEAWPNSPTGDGQTRFYKDRYYGFVLDSRQMPIPGARIEGYADPSIPFESGADGSYSAYSFDGFAFLRATHPAYGTLPDSHHYNTTALRWDMVLPAKVNAVTNGGFEDGMNGWQPIGTEPVTPNPGLSHSGYGSVGLARLRTAGTAGVSQTITVPPTAGRPTLSLAVLPDSEQVSRDVLHASVTAQGGADSDLSLNWGDQADGWTYAWADLSAWGGQTVALTISVALKGGEPGGVIVDEVAVGEWHTPRIVAVDGPAGVTGTVTVKGENFEPGAVVRIADTPLVTTFVDTNTLTAELAGVQPGLRALWVANPRGEEALAYLRVGNPVFMPFTSKGE